MESVKFCQIQNHLIPQISGINTEINGWYIVVECSSPTKANVTLSDSLCFCELVSCVLSVYIIMRLHGHGTSGLFILFSEEYAQAHISMHITIT